MGRRTFEGYVVTFRARPFVSLPFLLFFLMQSWGNLLRAQERPTGPLLPQAPQPSFSAPTARAPSDSQQAGGSPGLPERPGPGSPQPAPAAPIPERRRNPPPRSSGSGEMVALNFNRADLVEVIHVLAQHLGLTYTIDPDVKGTVTIYSAAPLRREDLLPIFHQVLRMNGAVAVKSGNLYRIVTIKEAKGLARPQGQTSEDSYALQIVSVRFFSVAEMKKLLTPFLSPGGEIIDYARGNFLIIMDLPSNIQRLVELRDLLDVNVFAGTRMELYQPKVASADELATEMTKIMQSYASSESQAEGFGAQFVPISRINQLLVISYSEAAWTYVKRWLDRIDVIAEGPGRRIFIYPVENGTASDLADTLNQALGQPAQARRGTRRTLEQLHQGTLPSSGTSGTQGTGSFRSPTSPQSQSYPPPMGAFAVTPAPPQPPGTSGVPPPSAPRGPTPGQPPTAKPEEQMRIVADPVTNSLVIYGTTQEFQNIRNILKQLDLIPRQVLMDVQVVEVTLTGDLKFGVEYQIQRVGQGVNIFDRTFSSRGAVVTGVLPLAPAAGGGTPFATGLNAIIGTGSAVRAFINALMTDSRVKVLSSPSVLATDNQPARIQVGSEIPILTGQTSTFTGTSTPLTSNAIQYRNTGVILTIIPQVNSLGLVRLQVKQEVSDVGAANFGSTGSPSFTTRDAETTGVVQNGETLVIGGIITERKERSRTGIPYLMDIPVIGRFFGSTTDRVDRTELVMLITPHVIRDVGEARAVTKEFEDKVSAVKSELERMKNQKPPEPRP